MAYYLEQIKTQPDGKATATVESYPDDLTAEVFYHSALNTNLRLVQSESLKAYYANVHTESGVKLMERRREAVEPEPPVTE